MTKRMKTDPILGKSIDLWLRSKGLQNPFIENYMVKDLDKLSQMFQQVLEHLGMDLSNDSVSDTPNRLSDMYTNELFFGMRTENFPKCTTTKIEMERGVSDDTLYGGREPSMVLISDIQVSSFCEHHFLPIFGKAYIAYIPEEKLLGLSKFNRIVNYFSRRPQVQERLTEQVHASLQYILGTSDVAVVIKADHFCVKLRGVEDVNSFTTSSALGGKFKHGDGTLRKEFFDLIKS